MKTRFMQSSHVLVAIAFVASVAALTAQGHSELAQTRAATAQYHDVDSALADGYVDINECAPGEGCHIVNFGLIDCEFEADRPEILVYAPAPGGRLRLAAVEFVVPLSCAADAPEGYVGDEDAWREDSEGFGLWEMTAWMWLANPDGMFAQTNPRVP